jgi:uncharacterized protein YjiS (DUF1127 family)
MESEMPTARPDWIATALLRLHARWTRGVAGMKHRKGLAALANFDDRALADIGLTRSDLYDALAQRVWDDPTSMLECRRTARRDLTRGAPKEASSRHVPEMLGVAALTPPPTSRPARYFS